MSPSLSRVQLRADAARRADRAMMRGSVPDA